jgi:2-hydroxy-palmitic acid dioxygenase Mpo1-like protein
MNRITPNVLTWQFAHYSTAHQRRSNLAVHAVAVPVFLSGLSMFVLAPLLAWWLALAGPTCMMLSLAAQGRSHKLESERPAPFLGPLDLLARILGEQCVTFPRFVITGGFAQAWRQGCESGG